MKRAGGDKAALALGRAAAPGPRTLRFHDRSDPRRAAVCPWASLGFRRLLGKRTFTQTGHV